MKALLILLMIFSFSYSKQYIFTVNKYDKEIELEAKIISDIASSSINGKIKLFIPKISIQENEIYSKYFDLSEDCESANFVFDKKGLMKTSCKTFDKLFFTNNYKRLIANDKYYGAFFWNKSRPNIVFLKQRLDKNSIKLSKDYTQFIEDIYD